MQPQEPVTEPEQPAEDAQLKARKRRKVRLWLALATGILGILCAGGVGIAVLLYDEETKIERADPDAVVDNFLRAYLVNRDDERAALYRCGSGGDFGAIAGYRADLAAREKQFSVGIRVTWSSLTVTTSGARGTVGTELTKTVASQSGRVRNAWQFDIVDQDGWRVCGARQLS